MLENVVDQTAQESDVRAGPDRGMNVRHGARGRVNRGSMWINVAPRRCASTTKRNAIGWFSAILEPMFTITSAFSRSQRAMVAAPRPKDVPKLGTEEECQMRAWFSMFTTPSPPPSSFLMR